ncbi:MAG: hypothetical protein COU81_02825 [Candidatus Portnoybacteria bacterium CG10_big_fil_rev_8_21_14_0_10_36_7]|uniref:Yeast cell wall synthesis Kre9/Knh1-like N-terminal domain-containing protein n=1 Tax=Candidatus Portnoybacteria bacterium CG10_big_fil_rev_8_21_14_0_10_36_7 TaxID=1974812 RepID=A0A2M8KDS1_9BACT|nr:MAG: hypothetical protein COU81_02825 [Candidatus Portnoybacteria bacterium CG10_big_fil_rev_8_21_14_0_10_36_7]
MELKKINLKTNTTVAIGAFLIIGSISALAIGVYSSDSAREKADKNAVTAYFEEMEDNPSLSANFNREVSAGQNGALFLETAVTASKATTLDSLEFKAKLGKNLLDNVSNWSLYKITDNASGRTKKLISTGKIKSGNLVFNKLNLNLKNNKAVSLRIKGDIKNNIPSGVIKLNTVSGTLEKEKNQKKADKLKINSKVNYPKVIVIGKDKISTLKVNKPKAGSKVKIGSPLEITWKSSKYPASTPISLMLYREVNIGGVSVDEMVEIIGINLANDGNESWIVPDTLTEGNSYFVKIGCGLGQSFDYGCEGASGENFSIVK